MSTTYQSRWGHHPVSREDFLVLKALHKLYWESLRKAYRWQAWNRKTVHQHGDPPAIHTSLIEREIGTYFFTRDRDGNLRSHNLDFTPILRPRMGRDRTAHLRNDQGEIIGTSHDLDIVADFNTARTPQAEGEVVFLPEGVMQRYAQVWQYLVNKAQPLPLS